MQKSLQRFLLVPSFLAMAAVVGAGVPAQSQSLSQATAVEAQRHMVVAANKYASEAGLEILRQGGSAVDAAITVQLVLSLVEPQSSGIGGGAFMLHYTPATETNPAEVISYDGRETAPAKVTSNLFANLAPGREGYLDAVAGGRSVGVPGVLAMLAMAHETHGVLAWNKLFDRAIELAETGFEVSPRLQFLAETDPLLRKFPDSRAYLFDAEGKAHPAGTILKNQAYADVLKAIRDQGVKAFYEGPIAQKIVEAVQAAAVNPGQLDLQDLKSYEPKRRAALCSPYRMQKVCGMGPPSAGATTISGILGALEPFDLARHDPNSVEAVHLFAEASRLAYADRDRYLADADYVAVPVAGLIDPAYLRERSKLIDPARSMGIAQPGTPEGSEPRAEASSPELPATSHFSIIDDAGRVVSMTTSVESAFGSRVMAEGFFLNNELTDFSFRPEKDGHVVANRVEPGKRPRSAMSPTILLDADDNVRAAIGSPGGPSIIAYVARTVTGLIDWKMPINDAVSLPHVINQNGTTILEQGTAVAEAEAALVTLGHTVSKRRISSGLNGFTVEGDGAGKRIKGAADTRREGVALGD